MSVSPSGPLAGANYRTHSRVLSLLNTLIWSPTHINTYITCRTDPFTLGRNEEEGDEEPGTELESETEEGGGEEEGEQQCTIK